MEEGEWRRMLHGMKEYRRESSSRDREGECCWGARSWDSVL